jgi:hypothetical protein
MIKHRKFRSFKKRQHTETTHVCTQYKSALILMWGNTYNIMHRSMYITVQGKTHGRIDTSTKLPGQATKLRLSEPHLFEHLFTWTHPKPHQDTCNGGYASFPLSFGHQWPVSQFTLVLQALCMSLQLPELSLIWTLCLNWLTTGARINKVVLYNYSDT